MQIMDERGTSTKVTKSKTEPLSLILVLNRLYGVRNEPESWESNSGL